MVTAGAHRGRSLLSHGRGARVITLLSLEFYFFFTLISHSLYIYITPSIHFLVSSLVTLHSFALRVLCDSSPSLSFLSWTSSLRYTFSHPFHWFDISYGLLFQSISNFKVKVQSILYMQYYQSINIQRKTVREDTVTVLSPPVLCFCQLFETNIHRKEAFSRARRKNVTSILLLRHTKPTTCWVTLTNMERGDISWRWQGEATNTACNGFQQAWRSF